MGGRSSVWGGLTEGGGGSSRGWGTQQQQEWWRNGPGSDFGWGAEAVADTAGQGEMMDEVIAEGAGLVPSPVYAPYAIGLNGD